MANVSNNKISILDCTLRDGGYINNWEFGNAHIVFTIQELTKANIDIIECGFLDQAGGKTENSTRFSDIVVLNKLLADKTMPGQKSLYVAMVEAGKYDLSTLPLCRQHKAAVSGIRYSFRKSDRLKAIKDMKTVIERGYQLFVQPISTPSYSREELLELLNAVNDLGPYAVYIVDTQGLMFKEELTECFGLFNSIVKAGVKIGFHSHNNLQLSYANAIDIIGVAGDREIIIDASVYGMGRGAGNLHTELLADFLNRKYTGKYDTDRILDLIDKYYYSLFVKERWGYSLAHFLSASNGMHPDYASFLLNKKNLPVIGIKKILSRIPKEKSHEYDRKVVEELYYQYNAAAKASIRPPSFNKNARFLLLASGKSVIEHAALVKSHCKDSDHVVALNHIPQSCEADFYFFNSQRRYDEFASSIDPKKIIVSSNVTQDGAGFVLDYEQITMLGDARNDNASIMFMNFLSSIGVRELSIAGLDGFHMGISNYSYVEYDGVVEDRAFKEVNEYILGGLKALVQKLRIEFVTPSIFQKHIKPRVIGVIPSRMSSTRLPEKPLKDICGLPMVVHVLKRAQLADILDDVYVATDSERVQKVVESHGGKAVLTSPKHDNGTLRMHEVATKVSGDIFVLLNGDEPLIEPDHIRAAVEGLLKAQNAVVSMLVNRYEERGNTTKAKVAMNCRNEIMFITRNDIPSDARSRQLPMWKAYRCLAFRRDFLEFYTTKLQHMELDLREADDHLRILENGYIMQGVIVESDAFSVDRVEDLEKMRVRMAKDATFQRYKKA